jgi:peptidoglycan/LPS O-acetylase OafA/YrhL
MNARPTDSVDAAMAAGDRHLPLDGLRGVAVVGVLLFHDDRLRGGFLGVDLFFALSGFLITGLLVKEVQATNTVGLLRFWERRYRRLLPAFIALLILVLPMMYWWGTPAQLRSAREAVLPALAQVANWHEILQGGDYWALFADPTPLTHLWSLGVEQQFYLVWPVVFLLVSHLRRWRAAMTALCVAVVAASAALMWLLYDPGNPNRAYEGTDTRASSIVLGALVALIGLPTIVSKRHRSGSAAVTRVVLEVVQWGLVAGIAWAWWSTDGASSVGLARGGLLAHSAASALLIATLAAPVPTTLRWVLAIAPLRAAGAVSYGWYLWHWPIYLVLTEQRTGWEGLTLSLTRWTVSLAAAVASYYVVEMPIRARRWCPTPRALVATLVSAALVVAAGFVLVPERSAAPAAFDAASVTVPSTTIAATAPVDTSVTTSVPSATSAAPTIVLPRREVSTAIWSGDSIGKDESLGIVAALAAAGVTATYAGFPGTGFTPLPERWPVYVQPVLDSRPDLVLYQLSVWDSLQTPEAQQSAFSEYTAAVLGTGAALVFVTPPPVDSTKVQNEVSFMLGLARQLAAERPADVFLIEADEFWGPFAYDMDGDGVPDRRQDGVHLCAQGTARFANWLVIELAERFDGIEPASPAQWANGPWVTDPRFNTPEGTCS